MKPRSIGILGICCLAGAVSAADWPQFRGPRRDNISSESRLMKDWPTAGPPLLWTYASAGIGYSGPAIVGDRLYTMGGRGDTEAVIALDISVPDTTPKEVWSARVGSLFTWSKGGNRWGDGPRATPSVDQGLVFALGGQGQLVCVDASRGQERWRKDLPRELEAEVNNVGGSPERIGWGFSWSPLLDGDRVVCQPGGKTGTLAALDRQTGHVLWRSKQVTNLASYSSPIVADFGGVHQYVVLTNEGLTGFAAKDGRLLWHYPKEYSDVVCPTPLVQDGQLYVTASGGGCDLVRLEGAGDKFKAVRVFANRTMTNVHGGVLALDGHVYGYSEGKGWICQELKKPGRLVWSEKRALGRGSLTAAAGQLYCYGEEDGTVVLAETGPRGWKERGRFNIPRKSTLRKSSAKIWTHPVIANGRLYLRDQELIFCFDLRDRSGAVGP